jgi:hypothetical protein
VHSPLPEPHTRPEPLSSGAGSPVRPTPPTPAAGRGGAAPAPSPRLPFPGWPLWLIFGLGIIPSILALLVLGLAKDAAIDVAARQAPLVDRTVVVTGTLDSIDTTSGMPNVTSSYTLEVPAEAEGGTPVELTASGGTNWGFPPSKDFPEKMSFLVERGADPTVVDSGRLGSLEPITPATECGARTDVVTAVAAWVISIILFWVCALGLPILAVVQTVRRRRARTERAVAAGGHRWTQPYPKRG